MSKSRGRNWILTTIFLCHPLRDAGEDENDDGDGDDAGHCFKCSGKIVPIVADEIAEPERGARFDEISDKVVKKKCSERYFNEPREEIRDGAERACEAGGENGYRGIGPELFREPVEETKFIEAERCVTASPQWRVMA